MTFFNILYQEADAEQSGKKKTQKESSLISVTTVVDFTEYKKQDEIAKSLIHLRGVTGQDFTSVLEYHAKVGTGIFSDNFGVKKVSGTDKKSTDGNGYSQSVEDPNQGFKGVEALEHKDSSQYTDGGSVAGQSSKSNKGVTTVCIFLDGVGFRAGGFGNNPNCKKDFPSRAPNRVEITI